MTTIIILVVVLLVVIALGFWVVQRQRTARLRERFGDEYDRTLDRTGDRRSAEQTLAGVAARRDALTVRPLTAQQRAVWVERWGGVQARFVDAPAEAVAGARDLVPALMRERGYPVEDFEENATLLAADHPVVVGEYRAAEQAYQRHVASGGSSTESLRQAVVHYRALFEALVHDGGTADEPADAVPAATAPADGRPVDAVAADSGPDVRRDHAPTAEGAVRDGADAGTAHGRHAADDPNDREVRR